MRDAESGSCHWTLVCKSKAIGQRELDLSGGRRVREVTLSHQFRADLFFPAKVTSC